MGDYNDYEALLEAPYDGRIKERRKSKEPSRDKHSERSKHKSKERSRDRHRDRSKDRSHRSNKSKKSHRHRTRSRSPKSSRSRKHHSRRSRSRSDNYHKKSREHNRPRSSSSERRRRLEGMSEEEKDSRTVYVWQLSLRVRTKDLEDFFSKVGKMDVVRLVLDNKTGKSRGVAFIQFRSVDSVNQALDLNGQRLLGVPIQIRTVSSEKCRAAEGTMSSSYIYFRGPTKLCVSNLHTHINEQMIEEIFSPYGKIDELRLMKDVKGDSLGTAFLLFRKGESAKNVVEQMNDFNLAGQLLKITPVVEEGGLTDFGEGQGVCMTAADRVGLMAKLAVGTGLQVAPTHSANSNQQAQQSNPVINSQCFVLCNMFDVNEVLDEKFVKEVRDDVVSECNQFGGVYHIHVDIKSNKGEVYVKCPSIYVANKCVSTLHGRSFDGRLITANYIPLDYYHQMFPDSVSVKKLLRIED